MSDVPFSDVIFQSTLPRGERLQPMAISGMTMQISIHAPARGATFNPLDGNGCKNISIHAPARGATEMR